MRIIILASLFGLIFSACKKDKYTSTPQITFKSVDPNYSEAALGSLSPVVTLSITDAEGDLGITGQDTSRIFLKNLLTGKFDSLDFPDLKDVTKSNFKGDILVSVEKAIQCSPLPSPHLDTIFYEIYVTDFAKNKSNVIVTDPTYFLCN